jgi:hypothetical protein
MSAVDPAVISAVIAVAGMIGSFFSAYLGVRLAVVRLEERQAAMKDDLTDHEERLRELERGPMDYARR